MNVNNTYRWIEVLDDFVNSYNNAYHRSIKMTPSQARNSDQYTVWSNQYAPKAKIKRLPIKLKNKNPYKFKVGDSVKLLANRRPFLCEYDERFNTEVFTVTDREIKDKIPTYAIKDEQNDQIVGRFYENELIKVIVPEDKQYKIEKVLRTRRRGGKKEYFVKFRGYPKKFNAWVHDVEIL